MTSRVHCRLAIFAAAAAVVAAVATGCGSTTSTENKVVDDVARLDKRANDLNDPVQAYIKTRQGGAALADRLEGLGDDFDSEVRKIDAASPDATSGDRATFWSSARQAVVLEAMAMHRLADAIRTGDQSEANSVPGLVSRAQAAREAANGALKRLRR